MFGRRSKILTETTHNHTYHINFFQSCSFSNGSKRGIFLINLKGTSDFSVFLQRHNKERKSVFVFCLSGDDNLSILGKLAMTRIKLYRADQLLCVSQLQINMDN